MSREADLVEALEGLCAGEMDASGTALILGEDAWTKLSNGTHALARYRASAEGEAAPIDMVLYCPQCGAQHIDRPTKDWDNPPHRSHLCHACGCVWRPADVPTTGVRAVNTCGQADTWGWDGRSLDGAAKAVIAQEPRP